MSNSKRQNFDSSSSLPQKRIKCISPSSNDFSLTNGASEWHQSQALQKRMKRAHLNHDQRSKVKERLKSNYQQIKEQIKEKYQLNKSQAKKIYQNKKHQIKEKYQQNKDQLQEKYQQNKDQLQEKYQQNKDQLQEKYQQNKDQLQEKYQQNKDKLQEKYQQNKDQLQQKYQQNKNRFQEKYLQNKNQLQEKYQQNKSTYAENRQQKLKEKKSATRTALLHGSAAEFVEVETTQYKELGRIDRTCPYCKAKLFLEERVSNSSMKSPKFSICCGSAGQVELPPIPIPPPELQMLFGDSLDESLVNESVINSDCEMESTDETEVENHTGIDKQTSNYFLKNIRQFNNLFEFTSTGCKIDHSFVGNRGPNNFRIQGEMYHLMGSILPVGGSSNNFAQRYIHDTDHDESVQDRVDLMSKHDMKQSQKEVETSRRITSVLKNVMDNNNIYAKKFKSVGERIRATGSQSLRLKIVSNRKNDPRRYNLPTSNEVAVILVGDGSQTQLSQDIIVEMKDYTSTRQINQSQTVRRSPYKRVSPLHPAYFPLAYPLLFPYGEDGFKLGIPRRNEEFSKDHVILGRGSIKQGIDDLEGIDGLDGTKSKNGITQMQYYRYRLMYREYDGSRYWFLAKRLFQQLIVDMYATMEISRLMWVLKNQKILRSELYQGLQDALTSADIQDVRNNTSNVGKRLVLPSSFTGGPRHMHQLYQDAMAIVRATSSPDYFITFTCNPQWPEIKRELLNGQNASDRPDLTCRVFNLKLKELLIDLIKNHIFGIVRAFIYVVEFQKRGLPHAHILLIMEDEFKPKTPQDIDRFISAELPNPETHPLAYKTVTQNMIHGPCDDNVKYPCRTNSKSSLKCEKGYPKDFCESTNNGRDGYPNYRRRNNGQTIKLRDRNIDNRWVVPHNLYLAAKYDAHINVEVCTSITAVKYLFKYVYKGHDRATIEITSERHDNFDMDLLDESMDDQTSQNPFKSVNEIKKYLDSRYVSASESVWRIFGFTLHDEYPNVYRLQLHLPNSQYCVFQDGLPLDEIVNKKADENTTLTAFFKFNEKLSQEERSSIGETYINFPRRHVYNSSSKEWKARQQGSAIGRMYFMFPHTGDIYYLRILLASVKAPRSFDELKTVHGHKYNTFKEACIALGLLEDDDEWDKCLEEAGLSKSGKQLRYLFATILVHCSPTNPRSLWVKHLDRLTDDLRRISDPENSALLHLESILGQFGKSLSDFPDMPQPALDPNSNRLINEEMEYDIENLQAEFQQKFVSMNDEQQEAFEKIRQAYHDTIDGSISDGNRVFFIDGPAGTGKTYLYSMILSYVRANFHIALAVASSGIAALLLEGGRTAHTRFKIPIDIHETSTCDISLRSNLCNLIIEAKLIVWDEAPMMSKYVFEAVNRTLQDIMKTVDPGLEKLPFGGKTVVFGGDFRQTLPVVKRGGREDIVQMCLRRSSLWDNITVLRLTTNMRLLNLPDSYIDTKQEQVEYAEWILRIGNGEVGEKDESGSSIIQLLPDIVLPLGSTIWTLIESVFPNILDNIGESHYMMERGILSPRNDDVTKINDRILYAFPGDPIVYKSADSIHKDGNNGIGKTIPIEYLNNYQSSGFPLHELILKVGAPVMLLRNLRPQDGLCNGTRLICRELHPHAIVAEIITGSHTGKVEIIPRIPFHTSEKDFPVIIRRMQFPVRLAFAMTINKSQGQTLKYVGICLPRPVFTHGQLYVALSRATTRKNVYVLAENENNIYEHGETANVVYPEILTD